MASQEIVMNSNFKGALAEQKVVLRALEKGYIVSKPVAPCRYDLILDDGRLWRLQVKYADGKAGRESTGSVAVSFRTWDHTCNSKRGKSNTYSADEIDVIVAYLPKVDKLVWIPAWKFLNQQMIAIRYMPPKSNIKSCNLVEDFEW
jgi:hypothetical protein